MRDVLVSKLLEDGGLAGIVEAEEQDAELTVWRGLELAEEREETLKYVTATVTTMCDVLVICTRYLTLINPVLML